MVDSSRDFKGHRSLNLESGDKKIHIKHHKHLVLANPLPNQLELVGDKIQQNKPIKVKDTPYSN